MKTLRGWGGWVAVGALASAMGLVAGCSPALNWRELSPEGAGMRLMFPCKPEQEQRTQAGPAGRALVVRNFSCKAQGGQYSLTWMDLGSPSDVSGALARMHDGLAQALVAGASAPLAIAGMTPDPAAVQQRWTAREAQAGSVGRVVRQAVFAKGSRVYQLLLQGERADDEAWDVFVGSVVLPPG